MFKRACLGATALILVIAPIQTAYAQVAAEKPGSAYVQCDGVPNNMSDGEGAARFLGAVTLLALFAPPRESADASKRKFGAEGVAACTPLITGEKREGNAKRRLGLIFGRAVHQIEAKNFQAAIDDVALARNEAQAAGFMSDPYFIRSRGRAFDMIEAAALLRMGRTEEAQSVSLRHASDQEFSMFGLLGLSTYSELLRTPSQGEDQLNLWRSRIAPQLADQRADRLELAGRFADSAKIRDALIEIDTEHTPELISSQLLAQSAVAHALAGDSSIAAVKAQAALDNGKKRKAEGNPERDEAATVELLDLYEIIKTAGGGNVKGARQLFAARSKWVSASLGSVLEVNRRLREGAAADELIGGLARDPAQLWGDQVDTARAAILAKDSDNKTLFHLIPATYSARDFEAQSKAVWNTEKSRIVIKPKKPDPKSKMELMYLPMTSPIVAMDAYVLHAALMAKSRGHQGFVFMPIVSDKLIAGSFRSGNLGEKGFPPELFLNADQVIAKMRAIIPNPQELAARQKTSRS